MALSVAARGSLALCDVSGGVLARYETKCGGRVRVLIFNPFADSRSACEMPGQKCLMWRKQREAEEQSEAR